MKISAQVVRRDVHIKCGEMLYLTSTQRTGGGRRTIMHTAWFGTLALLIALTGCNNLLSSNAPMASSTPLTLPLTLPPCPTTEPSAKVTIDFSSPIGTSQFSPGISYVDDTLNYPWGNNDLAAVNNVKSLITEAIPYENTPIMAWGSARSLA